MRSLHTTPPLKGMKRRGSLSAAKQWRDQRKKGRGECKAVSHKQPGQKGDRFPRCVDFVNEWILDTYTFRLDFLEIGFSLFLNERKAYEHKILIDIVCEEFTYPA